MEYTDEQQGLINLYEDDKFNYEEVMKQYKETMNDLIVSLIQNEENQRINLCEFDTQPIKTYYQPRFKNILIFAVNIGNGGNVIIEYRGEAENNVFCNTIDKIDVEAMSEIVDRILNIMDKR